MNKRDAVYRFVSEMNAIPQGMIQKLMKVDSDDWREITAPSTGDCVYVFDRHCEGEIVNSLSGADIYLVNLDNEDGDAAEIEIGVDDFEVLRNDVLPMWGIMWSFGDSLDDWWLTEKDGIRIMSECGFRIYKSEEFGFFFGIDGAGYDFYEAHWIPLYDARGLKWHNEND